MRRHRAKLIDDQARKKNERKKEGRKGRKKEERNQICMMIMRS